MHTPRYLERDKRVHVGSFSPAASLTEDLPQGVDADILLLGCGDLRHILYTSFTEQGFPERKLDITACDIDEYLIARNILFLTLLLDDDDDISLDQLWNVYYHILVDPADVLIIGNQAKKLLPLSRSLQDWHTSAYGATLRFCDEGTLALVHSIWARYAKDSDCRYPWNKPHWEPFWGNLSEARQSKWATVRTSEQDVSRSCGPLSMKIAGTLLFSTKQHWERGVTGSTPLPPLQQNKTPEIPNPVFAIPLMESSSLQYPTNPLLSFHLAAAEAKLTESSPLWLKEKHYTHQGRDDRLFRTACLQFDDWTDAFIAAAAKTVIRFTVCDCFTLCHTLRYNAVLGRTCAQWYRADTGFDVFRLAESEYGSEGSAPKAFDIIDTSTISNDTSILNLLVSASPLLKDAPSSTLYTECLHSTGDGNFESLLCQQTTTISMLLGLVPAEYWTNAKADSRADEVWTAWSDEKAKQEAREATFDARLSWKQSKHMAGTKAGAAPLRASVDDLVDLASSVYQSVFEHEFEKRSAPNVELDKLICKQLPELQHTPATILALVNALGGRAQVDLTKLRDDFIARLLRVPKTKAYAAPQLGDLLLHAPAASYCPRGPFDSMTEQPPFREWTHVPEFLAVTAVIPAGKWKEGLASRKGEMFKALWKTRLAAQLQQTSDNKPMPGVLNMATIYADVQVSFGTIKTEGTRNQDNFTISVVEDKTGLGGPSDMIISFYALTEPVASMFCAGGAVMLRTMFTNLNPDGWEGLMFDMAHLPEAPARDENRVFYTKLRPGQAGCAVSEGVLQELQYANNWTQHIPTPGLSFTADFDKESKGIATFTGRVDIATAEGKKLLADKVPIELQQRSPFTLDIVFGKKTLTIPLTFPAPVLKDGSKTRVARKSSYMEIVAPLAKPTTSPRILDAYLFPTTLLTTTPTGTTLPATLNLPHLNLDNLPILALDDKSRLRFLTTLTSLTFSARERRLRERLQQGHQADSNPTPTPNATLSPCPRLNFKESLFTIFMLASGLQGGQTGLFALTHPSRGGIHALLFASAVRLDGAHGSVVLDAAVLPLTRELVDSKELEGFLLVLRSLECCALEVDDGELGLWKGVLPGMVERCRTWEHRQEDEDGEDGKKKKKKCEYITGKKVPVSLEDGGPVLCSCGQGKLPPEFVALPEWDVAARYATRVAISPVYASALVEELIDPALAKAVAKNEALAEDAGDALKACRSCGKKEEGVEGVRLRRCMRCLQVSYCSAECQKKDWKTHRMECEEADVHKLPVREKAAVDV